MNKALGESGKDTTIPVEKIEPVREFGVDTAQNNSQAELVSATPVPAETPAGPSKAGFANNKFFMVIAIVFFVAACVFLGYEAFRYFQLVK